MKNKGFTLIELLIVVAIIAILAAIAVPNFLEAQVRSKVSRVRADMRSAATALESYAVDNNGYPPMADAFSGATWDPFDETSGAFPLDHFRLPSWLTTPQAYITSLYTDPFKVGLDSGIDESLFSRDEYYNVRQLKGYSSSWLHIEQHTGGWLIISYGPDRKLITSSYMFDLEVNPPYDPTNGTVSEGNILRSAKYSDGNLPPYNLATWP